MLLQNNPKKPHQQTPSQLIATSSLSSYWDKPHKYLQKAKQKKSSPGGLLCLVSRYNTIQRAVQLVAAYLRAAYLRAVQRVAA